MAPVLCVPAGSRPSPRPVPPRPQLEHILDQLDLAEERFAAILDG